MNRLDGVTDAGWLNGAHAHRSRHCDRRPADTAIDAVIVHGISLPPGSFGHGWIESFFTGGLDAGAHPFFAEIADRRVSAHCLIARTGQLTQFVSFDDRAWHAGRSVLAGRERVNDFSIGIELEGADDCPYSPAQYRRLADLCRALMARYPRITANRIAGHDDVAPGRKTDPGRAFDWAGFRRLLASESAVV